jgi:hypothetical protein
MASSMATLLLLAVDVVATAGADALDCAFPAAQQQQQQPWLTASSTVGPFGHVFSDGAWSAAVVLQGAANHSSGSDAHGTFGGPLYRGGCRVGPKCKRPALGDRTVLKIAKAHNVSAAEVGMRWILQQGLLLATASAEAEYDTEDTEGVWAVELTDRKMAQLSAIKHEPLAVDRSRAAGSLVSTQAI